MQCEKEIPHMTRQIRNRTVQALAKTADRNDAPDRSWRAHVTDPSLHAVIAFCLIGFLLMLNLMLRFPDFGAIIAQYNQF
jgi:hypothetical protein